MTMASTTTKPVQPLQSGIAGTVDSLSAEAKAEIKALSGPRLLPFLGSALLSWVSIGILIYAAETVNHLAFTIPVLFLIASRQMALGYLLHEQAHYLGFKTKYGDLIANLLICYPIILITVQKYAQVHITHHRHYFTEDDPDFIRKSGDEWAQPMPGKQLLKLFLQDLFAFNVIKLIRGKKMPKKPYPRRWDIPAWVQPLYTLVALGLITWFSVWPEFLLYWILPLLTFFQLISRLGALCEHRYNLVGASLEESSPIIILTWWQKLLIPDLNFHYHIYHHYFPGVSFSNLPKVHKIFVREGLVVQDNVYKGYFDYFKKAIIEPVTQKRVTE